MQLLSTLILLFFLIPSEIDEEKIPWNEDRKLVWADFKGVPNGPPDYVASTNSGVSFSYSYRERNGVGEIKFTVLSNFYPNLSWYRPSKVSDYILAHEQMHFDISELYARKLRLRLAVIPHDRDFKSKAETVYDQIEADRREMQFQYDVETDHSNSKEEEFHWRDYIAKQLQVYNSWK